MSLVFSFLRMAEDWQMNVSILSAIGKIGANIEFIRQPLLTLQSWRFQSLRIVEYM